MDIEEKIIRFSTKETRSNLASKLNLPYNDVMQDWEWEVSSQADFDTCYRLYMAPSTQDDEKFSLMEIMISIVADEIVSGQLIDQSAKWGSISSLLYMRPKLHAYSIYNWKKFNGDHEFNNLGKAMIIVWNAIEHTL